MKSKVRVIAVAVLLLAVIAAACIYISSKDSTNRPYEPDGPAPEAHNGLYVSEHGSMTFSGNGSDVVFDFDEYLSELTGLPSGEREGQYTFMSGDLPETKSTEVRYDVAHELVITLKGEGEEKVTAVIGLGIASADGKSAQSGTGTVTQERIPMLFLLDGKSVSVVFERKN